MATQESAEPVDPVECPTTKQLLDWLDGNCELAPAVLNHLEACTQCRTTLNSLSDDESLGVLVSQSLTSPCREFSNEPEFERLRLSLCDASLEVPGAESSERAQRLGDEAVTTRRTQLTSVEDSLPPLAAPSVQSLNQRLPIGRYTVDRLIGEGGAGAVYLAFDHRLHREVAIKVLGRNSLRDRQRFLREARILAELEHANIVRIYDFGTLAFEASPDDPAVSLESARLYLVMEYVPGGSANALRVCQPELHSNTVNTSVSSSNPNSLGFRQLASLIATAADGLAAAHARSLVHRDVKPANLLLAAGWESVKVADFGLAKPSDIDATQVTRTGELMGTPVFMSPEQLTSTNLSASTDIYSLGATLYQLLTGSPPFQGSTAAILRQISETEPIPPRVLHPSIPDDLETICLHAMQKAASDRYASMSALADDLRRFAASEPIQAKPTSTSTKAYRFLRRNPGFTSVLLLAVTLLLALSIGSAATAFMFARQNARLKMSSEAESAAKLAAQDSLRDAIEAADQLLLSVTEDTELLPRTPGSEEVAQKLLTKAQEYYRRLMSDANASSQVPFDAARARAGLAQIALRLGDAEGVESEAEAALELLDSLPESAVPARERVAVRVTTLGVLGKSLATRGIFDRAIEVMSEAVTACERELQRNPEDQRLKSLLADSLRGLAVPQNMAGKLADAEANLGHAQRLFSALLTIAPNDPTYLRRAAGCESTLAVSLVRNDGYESARVHLLKANEILKLLERDGQLPIRLRPDYTSNIVNLASVEFYLGNHERAKELFAEAGEAYQQLSMLEPSVVEHRYNEVLTTLNSGKVAVALGTVDDMIVKYQELVPKMEALLLLSPESSEYLGTLGLIQGNIAVLLRMLERYDEALDSLEQAAQTLDQYAKLVDNTPDSLYAVALNNYELAKCNLSLHRVDAGLRAVALSRSTTASILVDHPDYLPARMHQVDECMAECDLLYAAEPMDAAALLQAAEQALATSSALLKQFDGLPEYEIAHGTILSTLGDALMLSGQLDAAENVAAQGIDHLQSLEQTSSPSQPNDSLEAAYRYNYLVLAEVVAKRLQMRPKANDPASDPVSDPLRTRLNELIAKCKEYGAVEEDLDFVTMNEVPP